MATATRNTPAAEPVVVKSTHSDGNTLDNLQVTYEKNKKPINTALTVVLVAVLAFLGWRWYTGSQDEKAATAVAFAQRYFESDSTNKALNGDGQHSGFLKVMKKYSGTKTANLCHYYAGICYLKEGAYPKAIQQLEDFNGKGTMVEHAAQGALGDAYMQTGKPQKAIEAYKNASKDADDIALTPIFLYRLGLVYEMQKKPKDAADAYRRIRDEFPASPQARDMDKTLARLGELN